MHKHEFWIHTKFVPTPRALGSLFSYRYNIQECMWLCGLMLLSLCMQND